jgi:hypothetical protein
MSDKTLSISPVNLVGVAQAFASGLFLILADEFCIIHPLAELTDAE